MNYRLLGSSGVRVSEVALGTMTFGDDWGWGATPDESRRIFRSYAEAGGNFIDTACNYTNGSSERIVGTCIRGDRDRYVVATKYTLTSDPDDPNAGGNHRKNLRRSLEGSLERLGTDYVDVLYLHMWDHTTPLEEVLRAMDDAVRADKVLYVGFSDSPSWVVSRAVVLAAAHGWTVPVAVQAPYSLADRGIEREVLPMAASLGLTALTFGALEGGILTGKHLQDAVAPARVAKISGRTRPVVEGLVAIAEEVGATPAQVAVAWAGSERCGASTIPILGARTVAQLDEQLGALDVALDDEMLRRLDALQPFDVGFPRSFLESDDVRGLIFGRTYDRILDLHRQPA